MGSRLGLAELWLKEAPALRRRASRLVGPDAADDVVAEAFTRFAAEQPTGDPRAVLARKVWNLAIDQYRYDQRRTRVPLAVLDEEQGRPGEATSFAPLAHATLATDFNRALRSLPDEQREAFILTELRGLTVREAADALGVSKTTVARHSEAARTYLERTLS